MRLYVLLCVCLVAVGSAFLPSDAHAGLIWIDGSKSEETAPPGKLLSDNGSYWGDCVLTGVEYYYESEPDKERDNASQGASGVGRLLLDGVAEGNGSCAATRSAGSPLTVVFDFKRSCSFNEVDLDTPTKKVGVKLECQSWGSDWRTIYSLKLEDSPGGRLQRLKLPEMPRGERLRLTVTSAGDTSLDEVWVWGDAQVTAQNPEAIRPVFSPLPGGTYRTFSIPGIEKTAINDGKYKKWVDSLGDLGKSPAVWSSLLTWDTISSGPIVPAPSEINREVSLVAARNETECAALALTSTSSTDTFATEVTLGEFERVGGGAAAGVKGKLYSVGAIPSAVYGVCLSPLFEKGNIPGASLMRRYITNADMIKDFPQLSLPPTTSAIVWVSATTDGAEPGVYEALLSCKGGPGIKVRLEVVDVTLPRTPAWVGTYSYSTKMFPFEPEGRGEREVGYKVSLGISVWDGWQTPNSAGGRLISRLGRVYSHLYGVPGKYMHAVKSLTDEDKAAISQHVRGLIQHAKEIGLPYDNWYVEFFDEPNGDGLATIEMYARIVKGIDPNVRIYCNTIDSELGDWYNKLIDISVPYAKVGLYGDATTKYFSAPRSVNAFYKLLANCSKNESSGQLARFRGLAWEALSRGWNGWGFYSYHAPSGDPWNDFDGGSSPGAEPDWTVVYPGPAGPIASRASEALREGYEDYCLISLLKSTGKAAVADAIVKRFVPVDAPGDKRGSREPLESLRLEALRAAAAR
jgi:hypothetical protein